MDTRHRILSVVTFIKGVSSIFWYLFWTFLTPVYREMFILSIGAEFLFLVAFFGVMRFKNKDLSMLGTVLSFVLGSISMCILAAKMMSFMKHWEIIPTPIICLLVGNWGNFAVNFLLMAFLPRKRTPSNSQQPILHQNSITYSSVELNPTTIPEPAICPVCLDETSQPYVCVNGHPHCQSCLRTWSLASPQGLTCTVCRGSFEGRLTV